MYFLRWLTSRTVRKAAGFEVAVRKRLNRHRDVLSPNAVAAVEGDLLGFRRLLRAGADGATIRARMEALETTAGKWLKPYPNHGIRDFLVMLLEIAVLIVGSRAFLIQPMVIQT